MLGGALNWKFTKETSMQVLLDAHPTPAHGNDWRHFCIRNANEPVDSGSIFRIARTLYQVSAYSLRKAQID